MLDRATEFGAALVQLKLAQVHTESKLVSAQRAKAMVMTKLDEALMWYERMIQEE